jgi:hypothetical protein
MTSPTFFVIQVPVLMLTPSPECHNQNKPEDGGSKVLVPRFELPVILYHVSPTAPYLEYTYFRILVS